VRYYKFTVFTKRTALQNSLDIKCRAKLCDGVSSFCVAIDCILRHRTVKRGGGGWSTITSVTMSFA